MTRKLLSADRRVGSADPTRESDPKNKSNFLPEGSPTPTFNNIPVVSDSNIETRPNLYTHIRIHPYPRQPGHILLRGYKNEYSIVVGVSVEPTGRDKYLHG